MRSLCVSIALALGTAVQQAAATGWLDAQVFKAPFSIDNVCDEHQKNGYDFTDLAIGVFSIYGGADFSGFTCANSFDKRDLLTSRTFNGKATKDYNSSPKISCGKDQKDMSIKHMDVSVSVDTHLEFHYGYENGQSCKQIAPCKKGGSTIENTQCGGAKSVTVKLPENDQKSDCEVGIHKVKFDCGPPSKPPPKPIPTPTPSQSKPVETTKPVESKPPIYTTPYANSSIPHSSIGTAPPYTPPTTTSVYVPPPSSPPVYTTPTPSPSTPAPSVPTTTVPIYTTKVTYVTVTTCPVTTSVTSGTSTSVVTTSKISTIYLTSTSTVCTQCIPQPTTPTAAPPTSTPTTTPPPAPESSSPIPAPVSSSAVPPPPAPPATCPPVLPGCMKTWVPKTSCVDNADTNCLCKNADFTKYVYECVSAWGANEGEIKDAVYNFAGLCAPQLPENPCIVTGVPPSINLSPPGPPPAGGSPAPTGSVPVPVPGTPTPAPPATGVPGTSPVGVSPPPYNPAGSPVTTLSLNTTLPAPCPAVTQAADGQPVVPLSSGCSTVINTQVVVPQVHITTGAPAPGASGSNVGLAAGSPPAVPAYQTPAAGVPGNSPYVPTTLGTIVGSASVVVQPPGQTSPIAFAGDAPSLKATTFGIFAGFVAVLVLA
ncbi:MAG: hypothetical protein Q9167_003398 [Letrouitia subvulpina]